MPPKSDTATHCSHTHAWACPDNQQINGPAPCLIEGKTQSAGAAGKKDSGGQKGLTWNTQKGDGLDRQRQQQKVGHEEDCLGGRPIGKNRNDLAGVVDQLL